MKSTDIVYSSAARQNILVGASRLCNAVKVTLGPSGRNVVLDGQFDTRITKDGVTVAKEIEFENRYQNIGAELVKEVANKTNEEAGDGTTTATILAKELF